MIQQDKLQAVETKAADVVTLINESTRWVNNFLKDEERTECRYELKKCRRQINKIRTVVTRKPAIALFGASQVGKSYMANNLLYNADNKLEVYNHQNKSTIDFIKFINPEGKGNEATGAVTRFTADVITDAARLPVILKIFTIKDLVCVLCDTYYNDFKDNKPPASRQQISDLISELPKYKSGPGTGIITDDDIYSIKEYLEKYFRDMGLGFVMELEKAGYWDAVADIIDHFRPDNLVNLFGILWNNHEAINQVFESSLLFLGRFNYPQNLYVKYEALFRTSGKSVINVQTLQSFFDEDYHFDVQTEDGQVFNAEAAKLCFLTAEIVLSVAEGSVSNRPFIKNVDIIDFPGARSRPEVMDLGQKSILEMMLRGKVSYLFNNYSSDFKTNVLAVCMRTQQTNVTIVPRLINQWISDNLGKDAERRGLNLRNDLTPLFIIFTWWNTQLEFKKATDDPNPKERIEKLFETRFRQEIIGDYIWHEEWKKTSGGTERFKNFYLLRDFKESLSIFSTSEEGTELTSNSFRSPEQEDFLETYKKYFFQYHSQAGRFFADPTISFNEASTPNKDGSELIIKNLIPVSGNNISVPIYINYLNEAVGEAKSQLLKHYHSDQADEQIRKSAKEGSDLQLKMDIVFGIDAYYFGSFIEHMTVQESEILHFYHDLLQSDKLVKKKDTNAYILLRLQNPGLSPELKFEENVEILRVNYNKETADETKEHFTKTENIDLQELFYGDMYNLQNNSLILAEEARDYWFETKLNPDRFNFFVEKGFERVQLTRLFETFRLSFTRHNLVKVIADEIRGYVDVQKRIERAEEMIAHITAGIINEFVNSAGWTYYSQAEKAKIADTNAANKLKLKLPDDLEIFETIERVGDINSTGMTLDKLISYMDNLNENLSRKPVDTEAIKYVPMVKNYQRWVELMKIAFVSNCDIPTYSIEANTQLGVLLGKIKEYNFSIT